MNSGVFRDGMALFPTLRPRTLQLPRRRADLVSPHLVIRLEPLLLAVLAEEAGCLDPGLEAAILLPFEHDPSIVPRTS
jgi:hypothetical protein